MIFKQIQRTTRFWVATIVGLSLGMPSWIQADEPTPSPVKNVMLPGESFTVAERPAFILWPSESLRAEPQPWVFYAPTLPAYPDIHEKWMHEKFLAAGVAVAGIDVGEAYGSAESRKVFDTFYDELVTKRGFAKKPCLLGRSRGGLWVTSWACDHPERFSGLAGIYPVFDFKTYPGLPAAASAYKTTPSELEQSIDKHNPILRMSVLAKTKLPAIMIHGDEDVVVPLRQNSQTFAETYKQHGAADAVKLIVIMGQGHNFWEGFLRCQELVDFVIDRAKTGSQDSP